MSASLKKSSALRHAVRYSIAITIAATVVIAATSAVAGLSPYLLAALLIPLGEFVACYRFRAGNGVAPQDLRFFALAAHAVCLTSIFTHVPDGLPRIAASVQYLSVAVLALGIGAFWFRTPILEAVGPTAEEA